jgi:hypothetical protein
MQIRYAVLLPNALSTWNHPKGNSCNFPKRQGISRFGTQLESSGNIYYIAKNYNIFWLWRERGLIMLACKANWSSPPFEYCWSKSQRIIGIISLGSYVHPPSGSSWELLQYVPRARTLITSLVDPFKLKNLR